jgi:hypothetical protein
MGFAVKPGTKGTSVMRALGTVRSPSNNCTSALGSSTPALKMPRGRWYFQLRATMRTPCAKRAEAKVSPAKPS